jgi:hypothetical protein
MRDNFYRNLCLNPSNYDRIIKLIKKENPFCLKLAPLERESFACKVVHDSINCVLFGSAGIFCATGGALAVRASTDTNSVNYKKVVLALEPLWD